MIVDIEFQRLVGAEAIVDGLPGRQLVAGFFHLICLQYPRLLGNGGVAQKAEEEESDSFQELVLSSH